MVTWSSRSAIVLTPRLDASEGGRISAFGAGGAFGLAGRLRGDGMAGSPVGRISPPDSLAHEGGPWEVCGGEAE